MTIIYPDADIATCQWSVSPSGAHWSTIDTIESDYIYKTYTGDSSGHTWDDQFTMGNTSFTNQYYCSSFTVHVYCRSALGNVVDVYYRHSSGSWTYINTISPGTSYADYTVTKSGLYLTDTQMDTLDIRLEIYVGPWEDMDFYVSQMYVDYTTTAESITVTVPTSGTQWSVGTQYNIVWTKLGTFTSYEVDLYKPSSTFCTTIANAVSTTGYAWTVPAGLTAGTDYYVKVEDTDYSSTYDFSAAFEIVVPSPGIKKVWGISVTYIKKIMGVNDSVIDKLMGVTYPNT